MPKVARRSDPRCPTSLLGTSLSQPLGVLAAPQCPPHPNPTHPLPFPVPQMLWLVPGPLAKLGAAGKQGRSQDRPYARTQHRGAAGIPPGLGLGHGSGGARHWGGGDTDMALRGGRHCTGRVPTPRGRPLSWPPSWDPATLNSSIPPPASPWGWWDLTAMGGSSTPSPPSSPPPHPTWGWILLGGGGWGRTHGHVASCKDRWTHG